MRHGLYKAWFYNGGDVAFAHVWLYDWVWVGIESTRHMSNIPGKAPAHISSSALGLSIIPALLQTISR